MEKLSDMLSILSARAEATMEPNPNDYVLPDGLLYCGKCHAPKQCRPVPDSPELIVYTICDCVKQQQKEFAERRKTDFEARNRVACFGNGDGSVKSIIESRFEVDDSPESMPAKVARGYVEHFQYHKPKQWLLFSGTSGIGKSFYAACICNAMIDKGFLCHFTSVSEVSAQLWDAEHKASVYSNLCKYDVVVIDDFGAERDSDYMREIQFNLLDTLLRSNCGVIITTNLSAKELLNPASMDMKRIYSRIYERSVPLVCTGEDRRRKEMQMNADRKLKELIGG